MLLPHGYSGPVFGETRARCCRGDLRPASPPRTTSTTVGTDADRVPRTGIHGKRPKRLPGSPQLEKLTPGECLDQLLTDVLVWKPRAVPELTPRQAKIARKMYEETGPDGRRVHTVEQIAAEFGVTRPTIYRHLTGLPAATPTP